MSALRPADNEWTTWTDAIILAEAAATALWEAGFEVRRLPHITPPETGSNVHQYDGKVRADG